MLAFVDAARSMRCAYLAHRTWRGLLVRHKGDAMGSVREHPTSQVCVNVSRSDGYLPLLSDLSLPRLLCFVTGITGEYWDSNLLYRRTTGSFDRLTSIEYPLSTHHTGKCRGKKITCIEGTNVLYRSGLSSFQLKMRLF